MVLNRGDLGHAIGVTALGPRCGEPLLDDLQREVRPDKTGAERENVGVIVFPAIAGRRDVVAEGRTDPRDLVGDHGRPDAGSVDDDAPAAGAVGDEPGDLVRVVRVVDGVGGVGATVVDVVSRLPEAERDALLQREPAVVGTDRNGLVADRRCRSFPFGKGRCPSGVVEDPGDDVPDEVADLFLQLGRLVRNTAVLLGVGTILGGCRIPGRPTTDRYPRSSWMPPTDGRPKRCASHAIA